MSLIPCPSPGTLITQYLPLIYMFTYLLCGSIRNEFQEDADAEADEETDSVASFKDTHLKMVQDRKWKLSSGEVVEDILYREYKHSKQEVLAHSWILDLGNNETESLFSQPAWQEIRGHVLDLPQANSKIAELMSDFAVVSSVYYILSFITSTQVLTSAKHRWGRPPSCGGFYTGVPPCMARLTIVSWIMMSSGSV